MTERFQHRGAAPLWALGGAMLLSGCMNLAPSHERPAAPVAAAFPGVAAEPAPSVSDIEWQHYFADERLKRLIALALDNNRDLRVAALQIERAQALVRVQRADALPTVNAGLSGSRQPTASGDTTSLYTAGLIVTGYELDFFGRVRNLGDAALARYLATEEARKTAQMSLIAAVATTYLSLQASDDLLTVTRQTLASRTESLKLIQLKFEQGASSELELRQAESLLESARVTLAQQTRQRALDENALVLLLGQPLPADLPPGLPLTGQQLAELPAGIPSEVLTRRPDVLAAEQQLVAAQANVGAARAAFFPRITLTGSVGVASDSLSGLFNNGASAWSFTPQLLLPLFDAGRNRANLQVAQVDRDIAVAQYEKTIQTAFREVADALASRATLVEQLRAQQAQADAEQARFTLADLRYRHGAASYLDVLDAQRALFSAQQAVVQVQAAEVQNRVMLYKVLGGGWAAAETVR